MQKIADPLIDLTYYPVSSPAPRGTVIVCPGGGYHVLAAHECEPICLWLNKAGFPSFLLRYRVAPHHHPAPLEDAARAVRLVRARAAEFHVKPDKIGILGFSAGGHLVTTLGTHYDTGDPQAAEEIERASSRPDAVVACYAVTNLRTFHHEGMNKNLFGGEPSRELTDDLSNDLHVTAGTPPTFLWHTAEDEVVPPEQSILFAQALQRAGVPFELHVFPHGHHGLGLGDGSSYIGASAEVAQWTGLCENWLKAMEW